MVDAARVHSALQPGAHALWGIIEDKVHLLVAFPVWVPHQRKYLGQMALALVERGVSASQSSWDRKGTGGSVDQGL